MTASFVNLDHLIVLAHDKHKSASFLATLLGLPEPEPQSIFMAVRLGNDCTILFKTTEPGFPGQHYAFRVPPATFKSVLASVRSGGIAYWATPKGGDVGMTYTLSGDTGFYLHDPSGHQVEVLTDADGLASQQLDHCTSTPST